MLSRVIMFYLYNKSQNIAKKSDNNLYLILCRKILNNTQILDHSVQLVFCARQVESWKKYLITKSIVQVTY